MSVFRDVLQQSFAVAPALAMLGAVALPAEAAVQPMSGPDRGRTAVPIVRSIRAPLLSENTFIPPTPGRLVVGGTGERYFVFDKPASGTRLPPVVLLPSLELGALERLVAQTGAARDAAEAASSSSNGAGGGGVSTRVLISGQVFVYRGRNYLLLAAPPMLERVQAPAAVAATGTPVPAQDGNAPASAERPARVAAVADDPEAADLIAELEREAGPRRSMTNAPLQLPRTVTRSTGEPSATASASEPAAVRAVAPLALRRGRLVRGPQGSWLFAPDNGTGNPGEPPLVILPCLNLQAMESTAERLGESASFLLSGDVSSYQGRAYVLPRLFFVERGSANLTPIQ